jgi:hypothetical protein
LGGVHIGPARVGCGFGHPGFGFEG